MLVSLGEAPRIWAVAAVFGQARTLNRLHAELEPRLADGDRLVYTGNYMGYGAAVVETLDEVLRFRRHLIEQRGFEPEQIVALRGA